MTETRPCPECGSEIPAGTPSGLCPKCLLKAGFESQPPATQASPAPSGFIPPLPSELAPQFPQLEILELLGKGGMGAVYKARQPGLDRLVAIKILPAEVSHDPAFAERFTREARALARLNHPHIVAVYEFGRTATGLFYFVMEFIDGVNLRQAIQTGSVTPSNTLAIVPQVCEALQFAHDEGIVHRDIKPENILIDKRGRVKIADFGLVKLLDHETADHSLTGTQQVMGTLRYMAPEQMEGSKEVDHRADIYSLGVVFYELLTGELPIGRFAPPSKKVQIDVRLDEVVLRALEKEPGLRWQHASDVKTGIESVRSASSPVVGHTTAISELPAIAMVQLLAVAIGLILGLLSVTAGIVLIPLAFMFSEVGSGPFWGWMGGVFGCICGGLGSAAGSWNTYRQLRGEIDWMQAPSWTVLDRALGIYGIFGLAMLSLPPLLYASNAIGALDSDLSRATFHGAWLIGALITFQAAMLLLYRLAFVSSGRYIDHEPLRKFGWKVLRWLTTIVYLVGVFCFFSYQQTTGVSGDETGKHVREETSFRIGQPTPWFVYEETKTGFSWGIRLLTWSNLVAVVALGALWLERRLRQREGGQIEDMRWHYFVWAFMFAVPNGVAAYSSMFKARLSPGGVPVGAGTTPYTIGFLLAVLAMLAIGFSLWQSRKTAKQA